MSILLVTVNSLLSLFSSTPATWNFWKTLPGNVSQIFYPNAKTLGNTRLYKFIWRSVRGLASFWLRNHESKFFWVGQFCFHNVHASPADIWMKKIDPTVSARASALAGVEIEAERQQHSTRRIWNAAVSGRSIFFSLFEPRSQTLSLTLTCVPTKSLLQEVHETEKSLLTRNTNYRDSDTMTRTRTRWMIYHIRFTTQAL